MAPAYGAVVGLVIAAALGWPYVAAYALLAGPALGWWWVHRDSSSPSSDAESPQQTEGV